MITSQQVEESRFHATMWREGYDQDEVDGFLDRVVATLTALERGDSPVAALVSRTGAAQHVTPHDVVNQRFTPTRFRQGYAQDDVDGFLDRVVKTLREYETR